MHTLKTILRRPLRVILKYSLVSLTSSGIDFVIFMIMQHYHYSLVDSVALARLISSSYGYPVSKRFVFHSNRRVLSTLLEYYTLVIVSGLLSYTITKTLIAHTHLQPVIAKAISETLFFITNFVVQKSIIFYKLANQPQQVNISHN